MAVSATDIQKLYLAFFNRPADYYGLTYQQGEADKVGIAKVAAGFVASPEFQQTYAGKTDAQLVSTLYQNLFGRTPALVEVDYWVNKINTGAETRATVALSLVNGAIDSPGGSPDATIIANKVAAAEAFYKAIDTVPEATDYSGPAANAVAKAWLAGITTTASLNAAIAPAALNATLANVTLAGQTQNLPPAQNAALTLSVDALVGGSGNDVFNSANDVATGLSTLSGLDTIDGGAGSDTLNVTDTSTGVAGKIDLSLVTATNLENLRVVSLGEFGTAATVSTATLGGLTNATFTGKAAVGTTFVGATTTSLSVTNAGAAAVTTTGFGGAVSVTNGAGNVTIGKATGAVAADANAITSATVKGGTVVSITDNSGTAGAVGSTLTNVSLDGNAGAATLTGKGITNLSVKNAVAAGDVTVANTSAHTLNLTVNKAATGFVVTDANATAVTLAATGDASTLALAAAKATTLTVSGDKNVTLETTGADYSKLTTVTSSSTGKLTADLTGAALLTAVTATAGAIDVTIAGTNGASTPAAQSVTGGAGNDKVTITGTLGKGSTLSLGAGSDTVAVSGSGVITTDAVVDAGAGVDTLLLEIVGSANVGAFKNFENFDVAGFTGGSIDAGILADNNTITNFVGSAGAAAAVELQNLGAGVGFIATGTLGANVITLTQETAGAITITSNVDETEADTTADVSTGSFATNATSVRAVFDNANVDTLAGGAANTAALVITANAATTATIVSGGSEVVNTANLKVDDTLTSVVVTGTQKLELDVDVTGTNKFATVDASGQTAGGIEFSLAQLTANGTVKLGAGADILTLAAFDAATAAPATTQKVQGLGLGTGEDATEQGTFDVLSLAGAVQAADDDATAGGNVIKDGLLTFGGAGYTSLANAVTALQGDLAANETVVFRFSNNYYVFGEGTDGAGGDFLVQLTGVTTVKGLDTIAAGEVYVF